MFYRVAKCDRCGTKSRADDKATTRVSIRKKDGTRIHADLCDKCLNYLISDIIHFGETDPYKSSNS